MIRFTFVLSVYLMHVKVVFITIALPEGLAHLNFAQGLTPSCDSPGYDSKSEMSVAFFQNLQFDFFHVASLFDLKIFQFKFVSLTHSSLSLNLLP